MKVIEGNTGNPIFNKQQPDNLPVFIPITVQNTAYHTKNKMSTAFFNSGSKPELNKFKNL
jgi:hypothetical protein